MENKVLAKVNNKEITEQDLDFFYRTLGQQIQGQFQGEEGKKKLLTELVYQELFYCDAMDNKLDESEEFKKEIEKAKESILKQIGIQKLLMSLEVSDEEAKAFYDENKETFKSPEMVTASHILVETEEEASKIAKEIEAGKAFGDAANEYSSCPSKENGGELGAFGKGQMVPEFEEVAFDIALNEVSAPVKTQFGYHLIVVTEKKEAGTQEFALVSNQIKQQLMVQKQNDAYLAKVNELKAKYNVEML